MALRTLLLAVGIVALPLASAAQTDLPVDPRWSAWLGCWDLRTENLSDGSVDLVAVASRLAPDNVRSGPVRVCVTPTSAPDTVRQQTIVNDETIFEELIAADAVERPISEEKCRGTRSAEWSSNGRQIFTRGVLTCDGQPDRRVSGLMMLVPGPTWVDVQLVDVSGHRSVRVRRYGLSRDQVRAGGLAAVPDAAPALVDRLAIEEVIEASRKVEPEVVQAAMVEVGTKFPLNRDRILDLDKADVPGSVVDVMVALSFPEKFLIERQSSGGYGSGGGGWIDPWAVASPFAMYSMYAPFAYQYLGYYDPIYGPGYGWVVVNPGQPETPSRAVNGLGYTRILERHVDPVRTGDGGGVVDRSGSGSGGSGGGGVSSGGYSGGGGGGGASGGGGRTAQPRPPGGV
jgi:hypothetical protein